MISNDMNIIRKIESKERKGILFIIFFSFLITFVIARSFVWATHQEVHLLIRGYTIHHAIIGILILAVVGGIALTFKGGEAILSIFYGVGLGLTADEFGFLVSWGDYWNRISYDIVLIITLILLNAIFFYEFWKTFKDKIISFLKI